MTRARELANFADNTAGLETLTVSDITDLTATATELNYTDGVGSAIQTQIDAQMPKSGGTFTGDVSLTSTSGAGVTVIDSDDKANGWQLRANGTRFQISEVGVADRLFISAGGNVGIGGESGGAMFDVNGTCALGNGADIGGGHVAIKSDGTGTDGAFFIANNDGTSLVKVLDNGKVGVGTSSPSVKFHVYDSADHARLSVQCANSSGRHWQFQSRNDGLFWIRDDTAGANRMIFDASGQVGIGCTPSHHLHIEPAGYTGSYCTLRLKHPDSSAMKFATLDVRADDNNGLQIGVGSSGTSTSNFYRQSYIESYNRDLNLSTYTGGYSITLRTAPSGGSPTERMRIKSSGEVSMAGTIEHTGNAHAIAFKGGHTPYTGTFTQTGIYTNQNNNTDDPSNGIFIERRRLADNSGGEISNFTIGSRGGQSQFVIDPVGQIRHGVTGGNRISQSRWYNVGGNFSGNLYLRTPIVKNSSNMFRIKIFLYEYSGSYAGEYVFSGYAYSGSTLINTKVHVIAGSRTISIGVNSSNYVYCQINGAAGYYTHASYDYIGWTNFRPDQFYFSSSSG